MPSDNQTASFQRRVGAWVRETFGTTDAANLDERGDRLLEEVLELLQAHGYDRRRIGQLADFVYARDAGEPVQEAGGVMVTLAAYCEAAHIDMEGAGAREITRIEAPDVAAAVRAKRKTKPNPLQSHRSGRSLAEPAGPGFPPSFRPASLGTRVQVRHNA